MRTLKNCLIGLALLLVPSVSLAQQFTLTQTTLSAAIGQGATSFAIASATNVTTQNNTNYTDIYIDRELMQVVAVNSTTVSVLRGVSGTQASAHASGAMVLSGRPAAFINYDPEGYCNIAPTTPSGATVTVPAQPTINTRTGAQWLCSSITHTWSPGFSNPLVPALSTVTVAVASATTILPSGPLFHLTGTTPVTTITTPTGCNATAVGGCTFTVIADTGTSSMFGTGGNLEIGAAITTLTGNQYVFVWDATNSQWVVR